ncbi:lipopolysaccharide biosynthesis protein [Microbacterium sp.]|uniref:lipopolysaccharide biosynthesis protein n=1 Tax=Microbacterium sp. TaxID=51671 RepID=UPI001ACEDF75|nr:hypothetical protein [Microbacterium sp.]MBN9191793.1 hypothetical protein [Microbacterium sp.]
MTRLEAPPPPVLATGAPAATRGRITRDSLWLVGGFGATAGVGFVFWMVAGATLTPHELGVDASIVSAFSAAATFASIGTGSALIVMLPRSGTAARRLVSHSVVATSAIATVTGIVAGVLVAIVLPVDLPAAWTIAIVAVSTVVWALFNLQSQALVGVGDARATLLVNGSATLAKLALLLVFAIVLVRLPHPVVVATVAPAAVATAISIGVIVSRGTRAEARARPLVVWERARAHAFHAFAAQNTAAVGIVLAAGSSLAFVVTALSVPAQGAVFAIAFQFSAALDLVGVGVATALARAAADDPTTDRRIVRGFAARVAAIALLVGGAMTAATPVLFGLFGKGYDPAYAAGVVGVLLAASVIRPGFDMWSARMRAARRVTPVLWANATYVALLLALVVVLVPRWGALGAATAVTASALWLAVVGAVGIRRLGRTSLSPRTASEGGTT